MADAEDKITVRNLQAEYDRLTHEIPSKASELSIIYKDIERAKSELKEIESKRDTVTNDIQASHLALDDREKSVSKKEKDSEERVNKSKSEHTTKQSEIRLAIKELSRLNAQVLQAKEEYDKYQEQLRDRDIVLLQLDDIIGRIKTAQVQVDLLEEEKGRILGDISTAHEASEGKLKEARNELSRLVHLAEEKRVEAEQAQARVKTYTDELYTNMNDYQIVRARLEGVWKKTFPELELPLN